MKLSEDLAYWRAERPDEWTMDDFIRKAKDLENQNENLKELIHLIDEEIPLADSTCDEPGITFSEACRRQLNRDKINIK